MQLFLLTQVFMAVLLCRCHDKLFVKGEDDIEGDSNAVTNVLVDSKRGLQFSTACEDVKDTFELKVGVFVGCWYPQTFPDLTESRCNQQTVDGSLVKYHCPETCGICQPCEDTEENFQLREDIFVGCWYPARYPEFTDTRCNQEAFDGYLVSHYCPVTCGECSKSGPTPPPTPRPTPQPTSPPTPKPTPRPTPRPTLPPSLPPTPTPPPTPPPTPQPTPPPTQLPTARPTPSPTSPPTGAPTLSPTRPPTKPPTPVPTTGHPTAPPTTQPSRNENRLVQFYAMGDVPYGSFERKTLLGEQLEKLDDTVDLLVHLGDMQRLPGKKYVERVCPSKTKYEEVATELKKSKVPTFIIPGDNDYYECVNWEQGLEHWSEVFNNFDDNWPGKPYNVRRQNARPENFAMTIRRVLFIGIHTLSCGGSHWENNWLSEWNRMVNDDLQWTKNQLFSFAHTGKVDAVVIFSHSYTCKAQYNDYWTYLTSEASKLGIPFLFIQGDVHKFIQNKPEEAPFFTKNLHRVVVSAGGREDPLLVTVDTSNEDDPFILTRGDCTNTNSTYEKNCHPKRTA